MLIVCPHTFVLPVHHISVIKDYRIGKVQQVKLQATPKKQCSFLQESLRYICFLMLLQEKRMTFPGHCFRFDMELQLPK